MDEIDRKLLHYLDINSRMPVKKIAALIGEKSEKVNYRLKRLVREGVIRRFHPEVNPWKIGFTSFKVYFQFQGVDKNKIEEMYEFLLDNCSVGWVASCLGRWDMMVEIFARDRHEFIKFYSRFHREYYQYILQKVVGVTVELIFTNKKWLSPATAEPSVSMMIGSPENLVDEKDIKIIKHLAQRGRDPVKKVAEALGMPPTTVSQRMDNLLKRGVITNYRCEIDIKKFNRVYCKSFLYFSKGDQKDKEQMVDFCINHPDITYVTRCIAPWDMEIEAHTHSFNDFTELMNDMRNRFPAIIRNFEAAVINKETGELCIPKE
jgi:Lrp/AsnC family leucine-responsive transcriptional regulator